MWVRSVGELGLGRVADTQEECEGGEGPRGWSRAPARTRRGTTDPPRMNTGMSARVTGTTTCAPPTWRLPVAALYQTSAADPGR